MKLNKSKNNKGKVHPSPFSLSSSNQNDTVSTTLINLLPRTILTLISILSLQDKEVIAYMISHNKNNKKVAHNGKIPCFDCGCFDCYTSYWFRWDSSPNRELIHQAIEAFEEHLTNSEQLKKVTPPKSSRRRENNNKVKKFDHPSSSVFTPASESVNSVVTGGDDVEDGESSPVEGGGGGDDVAAEEGGTQVQNQQNKGLARKVLPDVIGLFNSRLWNLWGPNV